MLMMSNDKNLTPQLRFPEFKNSGEWEEDIAKNIFMTISEKNHPELSVLAATQEYGMVKRDDINYKIQYNNENTSSYKKVSKGDFVIHLRSFQGGFAYSDIEGITSPAYTVFRIQNIDKHSPYFWKYIFSSTQFIKKLELITYGVRDGRSISFKDFSQFKFLFPPLKEQKKIAGFLSSVDELLEQEKIKLENLKEYKKGLLQNFFPKENQKVPDLRFPEFKNSGEWEEKKLDEIVDILDNLRQPIAKYKRTQGNYPYYGANGIMDYINAYIFDGTYLLIGEDGSVINKDNSPIMHIVAGKFWVNNHAHVVKEKSQLYNLYFIYYALHNTNIEGFVKGVPPKLNQANLRQLKIIMTDIIEQEKIANVLLSIDELIIAQIRKILLLKEYKKGLLQQLFPNNN